MGLIKVIPNGYEITEDSLEHDAISGNTKCPIYTAICDFCIYKGITPPVWDKSAMSVILTKYNIPDLPSDNEYNIRFQLENRCKRLPKDITLEYFVKALGMENQYKALKEVRANKAKNIFEF